MTKVPGIGKKSAERILFEAKARIDKIPVVQEDQKDNLVQGDSFEEAVQGLIYLGVKFSVAHSAVEKAVGILGPNSPVEELIKEGLKQRSAR